MKQDLQTELVAQETLVFVWRTGNFFFALLAFIFGWNGHEFVMLVMFIFQAIYNLKNWPAIREELNHRREMVAFKQQIENLYVFSQRPNSTDPTVAATFERTLEMLRLSGNEHEVRVHMVMFRDVVILTSWYDRQGRRHDEKKWRETGARFQSWDEYVQDCGVS